MAAAARLAELPTEPEQLDHASAARMPNRHMLVMLTPWAPGCFEKTLSENTRWFWSKRPDQVLRGVLSKLQIGPADCDAARCAFTGDIHLIGPAAEAPHPVSLAAITDGLTLDEAEAVLAWLVAIDWRPKPPAQPSQPQD